MAIGRRLAGVVLAVLAVLLLVLGAVLPSWRGSSAQQRSFSLVTVFAMFERQTYADDLNRVIGALLPVGFVCLLVCTAVAVVVGIGVLLGGRSRSFLRVARVVAVLLSVGAVVPGLMALIALSSGDARLGMVLYVPGVVLYAVLCFNRGLTDTWSMPL